MKHLSAFFICFFLCSFAALAQSKKNFNIIAYYAGGPEKVFNLPAEKLTHIIYSFCHLVGNKLTVADAKDSSTLYKLVELRQRNPNLKIILSLGGWGGCPSCSDVFSTENGIQEFSLSVLELNRHFRTNGIDLDWEYPAIEGFPGHTYKPQDKQNFTALVKALRKTLGNQYEISFAAGGFQKFLDGAVEWVAVMKEVDRVNLMSYDLINGYSTATGHHTALYNTDLQKESTHNAVQYLINSGVPRNKIVIGAAFYARIWENVPPVKNGLYQSGKFKTSIPYRMFPAELTGFQFYWDDTAKAPYGYNALKKLFATFDDIKSLQYKTRYVIDQKLDGIMFWELNQDTDKNDLLNSIFNERK